MDPLTMLLIFGGTTLLKGGMDFFGRRSLANRQEKMANELESRYPRPEMPVFKYNVPEALYQNREMALSAYYDTLLPGQAYIENQVQGATGAAAGAITRSGGSAVDVLSALTTVYGNEQNQMARIGLAGAEMQVRDLDRVLGTNEAIAGAEATAEQIRLQQLMNKWKFEEADPYMFAMQSAARLREAQLMNNFNSLSSLGNTLGEAGSIFGYAAMSQGGFGSNAPKP